MIEVSTGGHGSFLSARWLHPLLASAGAATFLYGASFPLVDSPLVCCPRLMVLGLGYGALIFSVPLFVPLAAVAAAVRLLAAPTGGPSVARGVLLAAGLVGIALIVEEAGLLIAVKGGVPAAGTLLGFTGASLIVAAAVLRPRTMSSDAKPPVLPRAVRLAGPVTILLGAALFVVAVMMPWSTRPHPMRLVSWPPLRPYWILSTLLAAGIVVPAIVAGMRMLAGKRQHQTEVGVALAGGIFATLLFVHVIGLVLSSSLPGPRPSRVFSLTSGGYLGLGAGGLIVVGALLCAVSLRRSNTPPPGEANLSSRGQ